MSDLLDFSPPGQTTFTLSGAKAYFYDAGTTTPRTVYTDQTETVPHPSPLVADASGRWAQAFVSGGPVKVVVTQADDSTGYTLDPCEKVAAAGAGASQISFSPTVDLPFTNVQAAIEGAAASAASGFTPFGLGVTGSVELLANLDATNIATGQYRFDGTTTGTFPTGVSASDTGAVELIRETSGSAWMWLYHDTTDRLFVRRMSSSSWGTWREDITANIGATEGDLIYRGASAWTRLAKGTARQVLRMNAGATAPEWTSSAFTFLSSQNTTSGTAFDFTGIPAGTQEIVMDLVGVSLSGTDNMLVQLGVSGGPVTTGYTGAGSNTAASSASSTASTTGGLIRVGSAASTISGRVTINRMDGNRWHISGFLDYGSGAVGTMFLSGTVNLGAELTQVRLTRTGTDTFDAGSARVGYR